MLATNIRRDGMKLTKKEMKSLCVSLRKQFDYLGFITEVEIKNPSSIKIGLHMSSFRIDAKKLGYNAKLDDRSESKGYKRTCVPHWGQRVKFNDTVNDVFDNFKLSARIQSGCYRVRSKDSGRHSERDWVNTESNSGFSGNASSSIMTEADARESCNSDEMEREHKEKMRVIKNESAKERRDRMRSFKNASCVTMKVNHDQFEKMISALPDWQKRQVKEKAITFTLVAVVAERILS